MCEWMLGDCLHPPREPELAVYSDSMQTHTHTHQRVIVHAHFRTLISADGHHNAKSKVAAVLSPAVSLLVT